MAIEKKVDDPTSVGSTDYVENGGLPASGWSGRLTVFRSWMSKLTSRIEGSLHPSFISPHSPMAARRATHIEVSTSRRFTPSAM